MTGNDIGWAVQKMRDGLRVSRPGWNGKGMWLCLSPGMPDCPTETLWAPANRMHAAEHGGKVTVRPYVTMLTADGEIVPWICSQSDLLAQDWEIA